MSKYHKEINGARVDVYDILHAYDVKSHAIGHAIKKLLMAGQRGYKDYDQDIREAIASLRREVGL